MYKFKVVYLDVNMAYKVRTISGSCLESIWNEERASVAISPLIVSPTMVSILSPATFLTSDIASPLSSVA